MAPFPLRQSLIAAALALATVPATAGTALIGGGLAAVSGALHVAALEAEDRGAVDAALGATEDVQAANAAVETPAVFFTATTLPTQSLSSIANPAAAHLDRSRQGGSSRLVSAGWSNPRGEWWEPSVSYAMQQDHSVVQSAFGGADSMGQDVQPTLTSHNLAAEWSFDKLRLGYRVGNSVERAAEANVTLPLSQSTGRGTFLGWQLTDRLDVQLDFGTDTVRDRVSGSSSSWRSRSISAQWKLDGGFALSASLFATRSVAGDAVPALKSRLAELSLSYAFGSPFSGDSGAQAYLRMERQSLSGDGIAFSADAPQKPWNIVVGVSMPF